MGNIVDLLAFAGIGDVLGYEPQYNFLGIVFAALVLLTVLVGIIMFWIVPKIKRGAKGFNVNAQLNKLDKTKFKRIKKMYFENIRCRRYVENIIIGNNGVFVVRSQFEFGSISKNEKGKFVSERDGVMHVLGDYEEENQKVFEQMKKVYNRFSVTKFYSVVVFPNSAKINYTSEEGFFGNLKDVAQFISSRNEYKMNDEMRDDLYAALSKENEINRRWFFVFFT